MRIKCSDRFSLCEEIFSRTMVIPWTWFREKVVFYQWRDSPQGEWDTIAELMLIKVGESGHPVFRATSPLSRGQLKSKGGGKLSIHYCADQETIETVSHNYLCKPAQSLRSSRRNVWRVRNLSRSNGATRCGRTIEFLIRAKRDQDRHVCEQWWSGSQRSSIATIWRTNWKVFTTRLSEQILYWIQDSWPQLKSDSTSWQKDTEEFSQFTDAVACREYTLPRDEILSESKGWIRRNTKIGPVLEVTTRYLQGKYGVEIRIECMKKENKDNSYSSVTISHGWNK